MTSVWDLFNYFWSTSDLGSWTAGVRFGSVDIISGGGPSVFVSVRHAETRAEPPRKRRQENRESPLQASRMAGAKSERETSCRATTQFATFASRKRTSARERKEEEEDDDDDGAAGFDSGDGFFLRAGAGGASGLRRGRGVLGGGGGGRPGFAAPDGDAA